jgi:hypothetical protein
MSIALVAQPPAGVAAQTQEDWAEITRIFRGMVARNTSEAEIDAAIMVCRASGFNPVLQHINLIDGKVYVTHKGLWHLAHRSGMLDGIEVLEEGETDTHYTARVAIYRKDMRYPFAFTGRYPKGGRNKQYGPEMALARAECLALRRAFDVTMPVYEEINWEERPAGERRSRTEVREVPPPTPAALAAPAPASPEPAETVPGMSADEFSRWSEQLAVEADAGVAMRELVKAADARWDDLTDEQTEAVTMWLDQVKQARKAAPKRTPPRTDEALLALVVDAGLTDDQRADAARAFLNRAIDGASLVMRAGQITVLDFPQPILDVLVAEQRERLALPDDDAGEAIEAEVPGVPF